VNDLVGKVAVITGAGSGIGRATGALLAEQGMKVVLADIEQPAHAFIARMNAAGNPRRAVEPEEVAEYVLDAVRNDIFWVLPGPRHDDVRATFDQIIREKAESMLGRTPPDQYLQAST